MTIHLIHGIRSVGDCTVDEMVPYLTGFEVAYPDYGYILGIETRFVNGLIVGTLAPYIGPDDILICHSNGCAVAYELMHKLPQIGGAVFINAALQRAIVRPRSCPWIDVYFNAGDQATQLAAVGAVIGVVDPDWGEMGHAGYFGVDKAITNIDCANTPGMPIVSGHSDIFTAAKLADWAPFIVKRIQAHIA